MSARNKFYLFSIVMILPMMLVGFLNYTLTISSYFLLTHIMFPVSTQINEMYDNISKEEGAD